MKLLIFLILSACSSVTSQDLAYNRCATTCQQQGSKVANYTANQCQCSPSLNSNSNPAIP